MKHIPVKYEFNNTWQLPPRKGIWCRDKRDGQVLISEAIVGDYVLDLTLFTSHPPEIDLDKWISMRKPPFIEGYTFRVCTLKGEPILWYDLHNNMWFDTGDIDEAERAAEYIWKCMSLR